jgi:hypothetical protein
VALSRRPQDGATPTPRRRGANPKRTWRQPQADVAPNPNPCQLFPIAAHCRFEPFQGLGGSRKRRPPLAARPDKTHTVQVLRRSKLPVRGRPAKSAPRQAAPLSDNCHYIGGLQIHARGEAKRLWRIVSPAWYFGRCFGRALDLNCPRPRLPPNRVAPRLCKSRAAPPPRLAGRPT